MHACEFLKNLHIDKYYLQVGCFIMSLRLCHPIVHENMTSNSCCSDLLMSLGNQWTQTQTTFLKNKRKEKKRKEKKRKEKSNCTHFAAGCRHMFEAKSETRRSKNDFLKLLVFLLLVKKKIKIILYMRQTWHFVAWHNIWS